jgi:hypothetical protein
MPRARRQAPELDPNTTYCAWQSFAAQVDGVPIDVQEGTRLRGDHPTVQATWWFWLPDGYSPAEYGERYRELYPELPPHVDPYEREKPPPPVRDEDALVCIKPLPGGLTIGRKAVAPGDKVPKDHPDAKKYPHHFVDVVPKGLARQPSGQEEVAFYQGQWVRNDHPEVERHPERFELPALEGTTLKRTRHAKKVKE